mmetsp:Transcript_2092/g.9231  ORF Transcript_2092/g.9231 Transcript_2092/m.9231 type:complete len:226 (+) Transcript_2092:1261-1938(+)
MTLRGKLTRPPSHRASAVTTGSSHPASSSSFSSFASLSPSSASPLPARDPPPSARPSPGSDTLARFAAGVKFASPRSSLRLNHCWSGTSVLRFPLASTDDADAGAASPSGPPPPLRHPSLPRGESARFSFSSTPACPPAACPLSLPINRSKGVRAARLAPPPPSRCDVAARAVPGRTTVDAATKLARPGAPALTGVVACVVASPRSLASNLSPSSPAGDGAAPLA